MIGLGLDGYEPDSGHESAIAFRIRVVEAEQYIPAHSHRKGQLILALHGALTCEVENAMWMVPPQYAVWVPGQLSHSNRATPAPGMLPVHRAGRRADAGSLLYAKDFPAGARADPYSGGARRRVPGRPAWPGWCRFCLMSCPASRRSTCSCRYQTTRKFVKW